MITIEQSQIHQGLLILAGKCDGAIKRDGKGFDVADTHNGHALANIPIDQWTNEQFEAAHCLCVKYRMQLPPEYWEWKFKPTTLPGETLHAIAITEPEPIAQPVVESPIVAPPAPLFSLTDEQQLAIDTIIKWYNDLSGSPQSKVFKLGGYAGTGKTTVIKALRERLGVEKVSTEVTAFTGKACAVLRRKGVRANTMHSLMYRCEQLDDGFHFYKKDRIDSDPDLLIIDEGSMISTELWNDARSMVRKILVVGDPGQLEPVGDNPNLMLQPDFTLTKIHRQASESPIITLAQSIRTGGYLNPGPLVTSPSGLSSLLIRKKDFSRTDLSASDQIICARNNTRSGWNDNLRMNMPGFVDKGLMVGEKLIVLRNNQQHRVFNGLLLWVDEILGEDYIRKNKWSKDSDKCWIINCHDEVGDRYTKLPIWQESFKRKLKDKEYAPRSVVHADYGYVITCHKSQGSEWDRVFVIDEYMPPTVWDMKRWRYTAITRAAKGLVYAV